MVGEWSGDSPRTGSATCTTRTATTNSSEPLGLDPNHCTVHTARIAAVGAALGEVALTRRGTRSMRVIDCSGRLSQTYHKNGGGSRESPRESGDKDSGKD